MECFDNSTMRKTLVSAKRLIDGIVDRYAETIRMLQPSCTPNFQQLCMDLEVVHNEKNVIPHHVFPQALRVNATEYKYVLRL